MKSVSSVTLNLKHPLMKSDVNSRKAGGYKFDFEAPRIRLHFPELTPKNELAIDLVVSVLNKARDKLGLRQNLFQLASEKPSWQRLDVKFDQPFVPDWLELEDADQDQDEEPYVMYSRNLCGERALVATTALKAPLAANSEVFIAELIEKKWKLTDTFSYHIHYMEMTEDESTTYYYFEAIFCQLSVKYPIPQVTVKVYFRVADKNTEPPEKKSMPLVIFRIEGQHMEYDVRYVKLCEDWILAMMKMKLIYFKRIENYNKF